MDLDAILSIIIAAIIAAVGYAFLKLVNHFVDFIFSEHKSEFKKKKGKMQSKRNLTKPTVTTECELNSFNKIQSTVHKEEGHNNSSLDLKENKSLLNMLDFGSIRIFLSIESIARGMAIDELLLLKEIEIENIIFLLSKYDAETKYYETFDITKNIEAKEIKWLCNRELTDYPLSQKIYKLLIEYVTDFFKVVTNNYSSSLYLDASKILCVTLFFVTESMLYVDDFYYDVGLLDSDGIQLRNIQIKCLKELHKCGIYSQSSLTDKIKEIDEIISKCGKYNSHYGYRSPNRYIGRENTITRK